tara:strand:+ start:944 stop:1816 length:873 start_codon:yes stop_codon:yes gene_type:complete
MKNNINLLSHRSQEPKEGVLYLVGTPIGNLSDLSFRAENILRNVSLIACEDTRQTRKILNKFEIKNHLISFNQHNSKDKIPKIVNFLKEGKSIAIVSDAGLPTISDPGEELVKNIRGEGFEAVCIPGPCAALTALVSSGLPTSKFIFEGFLPKKQIQREKLLLEISQNQKTTILYESPHRLLRLLNELKLYCGGDREIIVARELTKKFEEHIGHNIDQVIKIFEDKEIIGEFTIVIKGIKQEKYKSINKLEIKNELDELIKIGLSLSSAAKFIAKKNNLPKNKVYNLFNE